MARKGRQKVKTGCITCKIRRVKCDESYPHCTRCQSTGRKCDGYSVPPLGSYSWDELLQPRLPPRPAGSLLPRRTAPSNELRSLSFFHAVVAPVLAGPVGGEFWTGLVSRLAERERAAWHAVLAISSLYERFRQGSISREGVGVDENAFAVQQYNLAIRQLSAAKVHDVDTVLLVCALFVCIEFLRGDSELAITHSRHGINLLNQYQSTARTKAKSSEIVDAISAVFCRLSVFPLFFGASPASFPWLWQLECASANANVPLVFESLAQAQEAMDRLLTRSIRFIRKGDEHRLGPATIIPPSTIQEQHKLRTDLDFWTRAFGFYKINIQSRSNQNQTACISLQMRALVCKIWVETCLSREEIIYDAHVDKFQIIVDMANTILLQKQNAHDAQPESRPKFMFEMGFNPLLYFVAIKCRYLRLRLDALRLMKALSGDRETLWDVGVMAAVARRIIEKEHSLSLLSELEYFEGEREAHNLPIDEHRIRDSVLEQEFDVHECENGGSIVRKMACFFMWSPDGVATVRDWVTISPCPK